MTLKYYAQLGSGAYLGQFDDATPPSSSFEVPNEPTESSFGEFWNFTVNDWAWPKSDLLDELTTKKNNSLNSLVTIDGIPFRGNDVTLASLSNLVAFSLTEDASAERAWIDASKDTHIQTNEVWLEFARKAYLRVQNHIDAYASVVEQIDSFDVRLFADLDSVWPTAISTYLSTPITRDLLPTTAEIDASKQPLATTLTDLSGITIASDVLAMMGDTDGAAGLSATVAANLALNTAAFHPATDFATPSSVSSAISTAVNNLINSAPGTLDTLGEIATLLATDTTAIGTLTTALTNKVDKDGTKVLSDVNFSTTKDTKLSGIATGATANSSDATLLARANHTGSQTASTISDFTTAVDARVQLIVGAAPAALDTLVEIAAQLATDESAVSALTTAVAGKVSTSRTVNGHALTSDVTVTKSDVSLGNCDNTSDLLKPVSTATTTELNKKSRAYEGTTLRNNALPIFKNATVGAITAGVAIFHLTDDGLSTGNALFPNGVIQDSVNPIVSDATASYQMSWAFTNSNKTITVTANKLTTANILTGLLGQAAATSAVVKLSVWGY